MRPVNLLPPEERRGQRAAARTGPLPYVLVGFLAAALGVVILLVTTNNTISEREDRIEALEVREADARARAEALAPYAEFAALEAARESTISTLAQSRFDWSRVMEELGLVTPADIYLTSLTGSASAAATVEGEASNPLRPQIAGPALEMVGCASDQRAVADYISDLEAIDGVTRVGVDTTERASTTEATSTEGSGECAGGPEPTSFTAVVAFDEAPVPASAEATAAAPAATTEAEPVDAEAAP